MHKSTTAESLVPNHQGATRHDAAHYCRRGVASACSAAQDSWAVQACIMRRMGCCGWRRRRMMGACDSAGAHDARRTTRAARER